MEKITQNLQIIQFFAENDFLEPEKFVLHAIKEYYNRRRQKAAPTLKNDKLLHEYQTLFQQKKIITEAARDITTAIQKMKFAEMENFLGVRPEGFFYHCENCSFSCGTLKGMAVHRRRCLAPAAITAAVEDAGDDDDDDDDDDDN